MSSFLCFVCHSTVNADTNEDTRDKYREVIGMNLCPDSHLCFICCHFLNKMWLFKSICLKRSLEYPVLFSEKGTINLQRSDTLVGILCPEDICLQHLNSRYHFYNNENTLADVEENSYVQLHEEMNFGLLPNNVEVQTDDIFDHFNVNLLKSDAGDDHFNNEEFLVGISKENNEINTRRDIDEFIFGNDSIESPLENINKIELTNLDEISEVNITLTDLNVRNFEKLQEHNDIVEKTYFRNNYVGRQDCSVRNNSYVDKSQECISNNDYVDKSQVYCVQNNNFVAKADVFDEKHEGALRNILAKSPELVKNIGFVEQTQEFVVKHNDFVESPDLNDDVENLNDINEKDDIKDTIDSLNDNVLEDISNDANFDDSSSNQSERVESVDKTDKNDTDSKKNDKKKSKSRSKNKSSIYNKITLTLKEQKVDLEANRKDKKYIEAEFKCYNCAIGFLYKDSYQAHMMRHEESNGEHRCSVCTLRFASARLLRAHCSNRAVRFECKRCQQIVKRRHVKSHVCRGQTIVKVTCNLCGRIFPGPNNYQQHLKRAHRERSGRTYLCNVCGQCYDNQAAVRTHMITHINRKFTCDVCSSIFSSPYTLKQHKKKHDIISTQLHYCTACNISYNSRKSLLAHLRNALVHKEKVYKCPVCDKTCPTLRSLHSHTTSVHARTKDLFCALCPARYSTRKGLVRHMKIHNNAEPKTLPLCHACGQTFKSSGILKRHLKNVCEKEKIEEESSNYYEQ